MVVEVVHLPTTRTLPHIIEPLPAESLLGFVFRVDWVNHFKPGTTIKMTARYTTAWQSFKHAAWASGSPVDLPRLAALTDNPVAALEALTLLPELGRLVGDRERPIKAIGDLDQHSNAFCEECWAESRLIRRSFLLPYVAMCPVHEVGLSTIRPCCVDNSPRHEPCRHVHTPHSMSPLKVARQRDVHRIWALLLDTADPAVVGRGYRVVSAFRGGTSPAMERAARIQSGRSSLASLVQALAGLSIDPGLLADLLATDATPPECPNATCSRFMPPPADGPDPLLRRLVERHCPVCGTRFVGRRVLSTFDLGHGAPRPTATQVRRAQRRLRRWRMDLRIACADMVADGVTVTVGAAFRRAGVPLNANLRAERLGLTAVVRDAARRQRLARGSENPAFMKVPMEDYLDLVRLAGHRDWEGIFDWTRQWFDLPTHPTNITWAEEQSRPLRAVLAPLFDARWVATCHSVDDVLRAWDRFDGAAAQYFSWDWLSEQTDRFAWSEQRREHVHAEVERRTTLRRRRRLPGEPKTDTVEGWAQWVAWSQRPHWRPSQVRDMLRVDEGRRAT